MEKIINSAINHHSQCEKTLKIAMKIAHLIFCVCTFLWLQLSRLVNFIF
jgi:hypothetical protein